MADPAAVTENVSTPPAFRINFLLVAVSLVVATTAPLLASNTLLVVEPMVAFPVTSRVLPRVVAPVTSRVLPRVVTPVTSRVLRVVAPAISRVSLALI